jgi:hypothetical protein
VLSGESRIIEPVGSGRAMREGYRRCRRDPQDSVVPRWIGWLALVVAVFAGWLSLLGPASSVIEGLTPIGFIGFFVFMAAMGIALLRRRRAVEGVSPPPPGEPRAV